MTYVPRGREAPKIKVFVRHTFIVYRKEERVNTCNSMQFEGGRINWQSFDVSEIQG